MNISVNRGDRHYYGRYTPAKKTQRTCTMCSRNVRRSHVTKILHKNCRACRYMTMMYGPNISVTRFDS